MKFDVLARTALPVLALLAVAPAFAAEPTGDEPYVGIGFGYVWPDKDVRGVDSGHAMQLLVGRQIARQWNLELNTHYTNFETDGASVTDFYRTSAGLDLLWVPLRGRWSPFLLAGAGGAYNDVFPNDRDSFDVKANAGLGVLSAPLGPFGLRLRAEGRYVQDFGPGKNASDVQGTLSVHIPLRRPREVVRTEIREVEVVREVRIPAPPPPPPPPVVDSDGDGVPDDRDRCPSTLPSTRVDSEGCAIEQAVVTLQGVHFETGSARLTPDSTDILQQAIAALRGQPSMRVEVRGHTDSVGRDEYNLDLSKRRAQSVLEFLVDNGIARDRLAAEGFGEMRPVADNSTPEGRASNRRVEFRVLAR